MARRMSETRKKRMPQGFGKTGSSTVNNPNATHREIFQNGDKMPGRERINTSIKAPQHQSS